MYKSQVLTTPHIGYHTPEANRAIQNLALDAIEGFMAGQPKFVVAAPS